MKRHFPTASAPFAVFNMLFLTRQLKAQRGTAAASAWFGKWLPAMLRALANTPGGPEGSSSSALAWNSPDDPIVGYGFEDSVAKSGALNFASLLTLEACATLCHAARGHAADETVAVHQEATEALCVRAVSAKQFTPMFRPTPPAPFHF